MPLEKKSGVTWLESSAWEAVHTFGTLSQGRWPRRPDRRAWGLFQFSISFLPRRFETFAVLFTSFRVEAQKQLLWRVQTIPVFYDNQTIT